MIQTEICAGCGCPILDQFIHSVLDKPWHRECVKCADCHTLLTDRCYSREGRLLCRLDFLRRYGPKCHLCLEQIQPTELVRQSRGHVYHLKCFTCCVCRKQLSTGEHYYLLDGHKVVCKEDYALIANGSSTPGSGSHHNGVGIKSNVGENEDGSPLADISSGGITPDSVLINGSQTLKGSDMHTPISSANLCPTSGHPYSILMNTSSHHLSHLDPISTDSLPLTSSSELEDRYLPPSSDDGITHSNNNNNNSKCDDTNNNLNNNSGGPSFVDEFDESLDDMTKDDADADGDDGVSCLEDEDLKSSYSAASSPDGMKGGDGCLDQGSSGSVGGQGCGGGTKRRGPRTTIKAKQLDTLKSAFAATPKPTRHVREQLAQETGLSMRVIQVWFQNRRSKERRMKQLSAMGARRPFFRNPRRMRTLRGGMGLDDMGDGADLMNNPAYHGYFPGNHPDFYNAVAAAGGFIPGGGYPGEFFPGPGHSLPPHFLSNLTQIPMPPGHIDGPQGHNMQGMLSPSEGGPPFFTHTSGSEMGFPNGPHSSPPPLGSHLGGHPHPVSGDDGGHFDSNSVILFSQQQQQMNSLHPPPPPSSSCAMSGQFLMVSHSESQSLLPPPPPGQPINMESW